MRFNSKHSVEELEWYIQKYLKKGKSIKELRETYGLLLGESAFRQKVLRYQNHGFKGIQTKSQNNCYSEEFKLSVIREHLLEKIPVSQLAWKYNIPAHETVRNWITKYTKGEKLRSYSPKPEVYTMKSRKTTQEEKIEIVKSCLVSGLSYKKTAEKYQVSYNMSIHGFKNTKKWF